MLTGTAFINQIWLQLVLIAQDLLAWLSVLALDGDLTGPPRGGPLPVAARRWAHHNQQPPSRAAPRRRLAMGDAVAAAFRRIRALSPAA